jgi:hypothetical protein
VRKLVVAGAFALLVLPGCGGGNESSAESWANDVCGAAVKWRDDVRDTVQSFQQNPDISKLGSTIDSVVTSTEDFAADLKKIGAPDTTAGTEAKAQVDELADNLDARVKRVQTAVQSGGSNAVQATTSEISGGLDDVQQTASSIEALSGDLRQGVQDASSCKELRS